MPVKELLEKIRWDASEDESEYSFACLDRVRDEIVSVQLNDVVREGNWPMLVETGKKVRVPLHRVKKVLKKGTLVWTR